MAGVKGKSGGARPNSGGARPGAGRKPKPKAPPRDAPPLDDSRKEDALEYLLRVVADAGESSHLRVRAAIAAVQYQRVKAGDGGKKDERVENAKKASSGRFAAAAPPRLVANNSK